jgi:tetratricopeptide (TPR) repeat protein
MSDSVKKVVLAIMIATVAVVIISTLKGQSPQRQQNTTPQPRVPEHLLRMDTVERELLALVEKEPDNRDLLFRLGTFYFENNRFHDAIDIYMKILRLDENDVETLTDLGLALHYTGNSDRGIEYLKKATTLSPDNQRSWLSLGFVAGASGHVTVAKPALKKAIELNPDSPMGKEAERILGLLQKH